MKARYKAIELVLKYLRIDNNTKEWLNVDIAKQCALIAVDIAVEELYDTWEVDNGGKYWAEGEYWDEVTEEIIKL